MKTVLGVDPGIKGSMVVLQNDQPIEWIEMPTYFVHSSNRVNAAAAAHWINILQIDEAVVELVNAMPEQGVTSMFTFGHAAGTIMGVLGALEIPTSLVHPRVWKKRAGILGLGKDASRYKAISLWPHWKELDKKLKGQAFADAALIARFGHE